MHILIKCEGKLDEHIDNIQEIYISFSNTVHLTIEQFKNGLFERVLESDHWEQIVLKK
jgi:hypothetical protein